MEWERREGADGIARIDFGTESEYPTFHPNHIRVGAVKVKI